MTDTTITQPEVVSQEIEQLPATQPRHKRVRAQHLSDENTCRYYGLPVVCARIFVRYKMDRELEFARIPNGSSQSYITNIVSQFDTKNGWQVWIEGPGNETMFGTRAEGSSI